MQLDTLLPGVVRSIEWDFVPSFLADVFTTNAH